MKTRRILINSNVISYGTLQPPRHARRHREVLAAQAERWRDRMTGFRAAAEDKIRRQEEQLVLLQREKERLEEFVVKENKRDIQTEDEKLTARAEKLILEREMMKMQEELEASYVTIARYEARLQRLEELQERRSGSIFETGAVVVFAILTLGWLLWSRH